MFHRRSCPYYVAFSERSGTDAKAWPGPVFAHEKIAGWTKLNAVKACNRCRLRHVKCSLIKSGGPCNHCRKRKEVCEVLGWEMKPDEPTKVIYKYVLPPPQVPNSTPPELARVQSTPVDAKQLAGRLERLKSSVSTRADVRSSPRALALLWPWGPDDKEPYYPSGPQFGENYHEECSEDCPTRLRFHTPHPNCYSPLLPMRSTSSLSVSRTGSVSYASSSNHIPSSPVWSMVEDGRDASHSPPKSSADKLNRMSLDFILSPTPVQRHNRLYPPTRPPVHEWPHIRPRLPSLRQALSQGPYGHHRMNL
ncbi:hypothetical protein CROQUDRAFT_713500 [Cronartium quercuum f. sp. fusiforme G11]|uniref:Zn(2)-C6 fungal-type domain-containing protein n=1 Tax=Cronartium quercuum f. sp. fusiforme G11 TaxID=708437 RepID=A0A9P6NTY5_9BASI|nr:hypothetical protein CROQUDRAFT_713500 [Cronartium quercuum f. sp. fusiforme G11]